MHFYDVFEELCLRDGVSPRQACLKMGLGESAAATWKLRDSAPKGFNLRKVAHFFNVSMESLLDYENIQSIEELKPAAPEVTIIGRDMTPLETEINGSVRKLPVVDQEKLLKYIQFTFPEAFEDENK